MTPTPDTPGAKAVRYAENVLGVHDVYTDCLTSREQLDTLLSELSEARDKRRDIEASIKDSELEIAADERGKHPEMSAAAMDKHLKLALHNNTDIREAHERLVQVVGEIEGLEYDKAMHETDIKIAVSRMQELGGYFQFLAAVKQSEVARFASEVLKREESST